MSKGKQIKVWQQLMARPVYHEIIHLLYKEKRELTNREIRERLFPLRSTKIKSDVCGPVWGYGRGIEVDGVEYLYSYYYEDMKAQTLNTYLKRLCEYGLIIRKHMDRSTVYRALSEAELLKKVTAT